MRHGDEYKEALALDALDALDEAERRALLTHLSSCAACRDERERMRDAAALLAHEARAVAPPTELRARVLESVRAVPAAAEAPEDANGDAEAATATPSPFGPRPAPVAPIELAGARRNFFQTYGAIAASLAVAAALSLALLALWRQNRELRARLEQLTERMELSRSEAARERDAAAEREREARELLGAPDARIVHLKGEGAASRASASLVYDPASGRVLLLADQLPPAPEGKAYQLWYIAGGRPLPGGLFTTDGEGRAALRDHAPAGGRAAEVFAVTLEPASGATTPSEVKYLHSPAS